MLLDYCKKLFLPKHGANNWLAMNEAPFIQPSASQDLKLMEVFVSLSM